MISTQNTRLPTASLSSRPAAMATKVVMNDAGQWITRPVMITPEARGALELPLDGQGFLPQAFLRRRAGRG